MTLGSDGPKVDVNGISLTDTQIVLLTLWGEGRSEPVEGRIAIGSVIRNRVLTNRWGETYARVCLWPWQFSCWKKEGGLANYESVLSMAKKLANGDEIHDPILRECGWIAHGVVGQWLRDNVRGATHYFAPNAMVPRGRWPSWAVGKEPVAEVGSHLFFAKVK